MVMRIIDRNLFICFFFVGEGNENDHIFHYGNEKCIFFYDGNEN